MKKKTLSIGIMLALFLIQTSNAQTWEPSKRVTWNSKDSYKPDVAVDSNNHIHIVWEDWSPGTVEIFYKKSTDGGVNWMTKRLTWSPIYSVSAAIAVDSSNNIHVVWYRSNVGNDEIYYKKSTDGGSTWSSGKRLTWNPGNSSTPAIGVDSSDNIHVVWYDDTSGDNEIYYRKSTDGGTTWMLKRLTWNPGSSMEVKLAIDPHDDIHVVWADYSPGNNEIYHKASTDGGSTWTGTKRISWNLGDSRSPAIAMDMTDNIHVVWYDGTPTNYEIFYSRSTDGGANWTVARRLTWNPGLSYSPSVAIDSDSHIHVVWFDGPYGMSEIYHMMSTDGGMVWTTKRLTYNLGDSLSAEIAKDFDKNLHVFWSDSTPGNYEIYYKRGIQ